MRSYWLVLPFLTCASAWAQTAPMESAQEFPQRLLTDPTAILNREFIRASTYIVAGPLQMKTEKGKTLGDIQYPNKTYLKGMQDFQNYGIDLGDRNAWKDGEKVIVFSRYDDSQKRVVAVAKLSTTPANLARVQQLVKATPDFTFSVTSRAFGTT
ncbi:hypothetical protein EON80_22160, partial [bacterium]